MTSNEEADRLESEGLAFRSHPTDHNEYVSLYSRWLDHGAIAFCTFVGKEFASIGWVLPCQRTHDLVKAPPIAVDYANHEAMQRGMWVSPSFRGKGLYRYTVHNRDRFLLERGITVLRTAIDYTNQTGRGVDEALGARLYGRGQSLRILWLEKWKESREPDRAVKRSSPST